MIKNRAGRLGRWASQPGVRFQPNKIRQLINDLVLIKDRAGRLRMLRTMHALDHVTQVVGWEFADRLKVVNRQAVANAVARKLIRRKRRETRTHHR